MLDFSSSFGTHKEMSVRGSSGEDSGGVRFGGGVGVLGGWASTTCQRCDGKLLYFSEPQFPFL